MAEYYFNLPTIPALTISQQAALDESGQISISGGPGTGKSVVSLWRHIRNFQSTPQKEKSTFDLYYNFKGISSINL